MTFHHHGFIHRFLLHVLPEDFHLIRHNGLLAGNVKAENLARMRELLGATRPSHPGPEEPASADTAEMLPALCPCCGCHLRIIEAFEAGYQLGDRASTTAADIRIETS